MTSSVPPAFDPDGPTPPGRVVAGQVLAAVAIVAGLAVAGGLGGVVWHLVAPRTELVYDDGVANFVGPVPSAPIAADGWFSVIALLAGIASGSLTQAFLHRRMPGALVGLAVGAALASFVMWRVGHWFGAAAYATAVHHVADGAHLYAPLDVRAKGVLLLWPLAATLTVFIAAVTESIQQRSARGHGETAPPAPRPDLPPIREEGDHTSSYPYAGPGERGGERPAAGGTT
ncbi:MAG: hypothetical protein J2P14_12250 [Acidothermales bacterium]|nr:hypothetical protein [Acidothermales bacterium]